MRGQIRWEESELCERAAWEEVEGEEHVGWGRGEEVLGDQVPLQFPGTGLRPCSARVEGQVGCRAREEPSDL